MTEIGKAKQKKKGDEPNPGPSPIFSLPFSLSFSPLPFFLPFLSTLLPPKAHPLDDLHCPPHPHIHTLVTSTHTIFSLITSTLAVLFSPSFFLYLIHH